MEGEFRDARSLDCGVGVGFDFLRIGQARSLSPALGGGGRGEELISPMRRRVRVSWAFVGTPFSKVLGLLVDGLETGMRDVLLHVEVVLPVWNLLVQHIQRVGKYRITEESEANGETDTLDNPITRCKWCHEGDNG